MIKASELRIGNWIIDRTYTTPQEECIDINTFHLIAINEDVLELYSPIPLTKELLLKFGFKENRKGYCKFIDWTKGAYNNKSRRNFVIRFSNKDNYRIEMQSMAITIVRYVHELQNIYFALTGEALIYE